MREEYEDEGKIKGERGGVKKHEFEGRGKNERRSLNFERDDWLPLTIVSNHFRVASSTQ